MSNPITNFITATNYEAQTISYQSINREIRSKIDQEGAKILQIDVNDPDFEKKFFGSSHVARAVDNAITSLINDLDFSTEDPQCDPSRFKAINSSDNEAIKVHAIDVTNFLSSKIEAEANQNVRLLKYADREYVKVALGRNGMDLEFVEDSFKNDPEIVEIAVRQNPRAIMYASEEGILEASLKNLKVLDCPIDSNIKERITNRLTSYVLYGEPNTEPLSKDKLNLIIQMLSSKHFSSNNKKKLEDLLTFKLNQVIESFKNPPSNFTDFAQDVLNNKNPDIKLLMIYHLLQFNEKEIKDIFDKISPKLTSGNEQPSAQNTLKKIYPLFAIYASNAEDSIKEKLADRFIEKFKMFKDSKYNQALLLLLKEQCWANKPDNYEILTDAIDNQETQKLSNDEIKKRIEYLLALSRLDSEEFSKLHEKDKSSTRLQDLLIDQLENHGFIEAQGAEKTAIEKKLFSLRNKTAMFTYASQFKGNQDMTDAIKLMISKIANDSFLDFRHAHNPHMGYLDDNQKAQWEAPSSLNISHDQKTYKIIDTEDAEDLFLCGTEVDGSCQRVDGDSTLNKCLMAYVLDGKIRLIAVKNEEGRIISRAIVKLLIDADNKPALFFEKIYGVDTFEDDLLSMAKQKAESMDIPMYTDKDLPYIKLYSIGSPAPFEYEDAGSIGVSIGGKYEIGAKDEDTTTDDIDIDLDFDPLG